MDILVIGNGLAGLSAAIEGAKRGASVTLISQNHADRSQSVMAEGGINAALNIKGEDDSPEQHAEDTLKSACGLTSESAVKGMTEAAPNIIKSLSQMGVVFSRDEAGREDVRYFGGQKKQRTVYANSGIGRQIVTAMTQEVRRYAAQRAIQLREHHRFVELLIRENGLGLGDNKAEKKCDGVVVQNMHTGQYEVYTADAIVLATGGMNDLFGETTGSYLSDGSVTATAFRQGVKLANLEMVQYHPTTAIRGEKRVLISEAARGEGGRLFVYRADGAAQQEASNSEKWYFMEELYPEGGNLMPRDIVSQTMDKVSKEHGQVYLDLTHLPRNLLETKLAEVCSTCRTYLGIEPTREYIPVSPGVHYFMGGFYVDEGHRCSVRNLYAAGECACQYHGANRLGGNSTLGAIYGGMKAVKTVFEDYGNVDSLSGRAGYPLNPEVEELGKADVATRKKLQTIMKGCMGIVRCEEQLEAGLKEIRALESNSNLAILAEAMVLSAMERKESRGAHVRSDYPEQNNVAYSKLMIASYDENDKGISVSLACCGR